MLRMMAEVPDTSSSFFATAALEVLAMIQRKEMFLRNARDLRVVFKEKLK